MVHVQMAKDLPEKASGLAYFFGIMGVYVVFSGWLLAYASRGLGRREAWARTLVWTTSALNTLAGTGAILVGFRNPLVLTWTFISASTCLLSLASRRSPPLAPSEAHAAAPALPPNTPRL
jgi:hypothetical protein